MQCIKQKFEKLFDEEMLCSYSYQGIQNKKLFSSLNANVIFDEINIFN